jgi:L-ascorbate metabolism protein UlaG (beta-lactamase superfamily)
MAANSPRPAILDRLTWLGHDSFRLVTKRGQRIYLDPFKDGSKRLDPADLVLISHAHHDHYDAESVAHLRQPATTFVTAPSVAGEISGARALAPGEETTVGDVTIRAVPAYNVNKFRAPGVPFHPKGPVDSAGVGFVITVDGEKLYHAGDTDHIPEMKDLAALGIDVALLPVSGTYVMVPEEAAAAAKDIRPKVAVPMHYAAIVGSPSDAQRFADLCRQAGIDAEVLQQA